MTERIVFFGDSLGDSKGFWELSSQILVNPLPDPAYYDRKFSNGEVQTEVIARHLGYGSGTAGPEYNYAIGGARAIGPLTAGDFVDDEHELQPGAEPLLATRIDLEAQVGRFLSDTTGQDRGDFTAHVMIGINDLSNWEPDSIWPWNWDNEIDDLVDDIVAAIRTNVQTLLSAGVGTVWVATQPDETFFPIYNELDDLMRLLSDGVIDDLNDKIIDMAAELGPDVHVLEVEEVTDAIEEDPRNFGRVDLETPILLGKGGDYDPTLNPDLPDDFDFAADANDYGFLDMVHPTEGTHRILGIFQAEVMAGNMIHGTTSADTVTGTEGDDLILASTGSDILDMLGGEDVAVGGTGRDEVRGGIHSDIVSGGAGHDTVYGGREDDLVTGGFGDDRIFGGAGNDALIDTAGSDTLTGDGGDDLLLWFDGALNGATQGGDTMIGGAGTDTLILYIADSATYRAATREYQRADGGGGGGGKGKKAAAADEITLTSLGVTIAGDVESVRFVDLSTEPQELPGTGSADLLARMDEWQHWDFA